MSDGNQNRRGMHAFRSMVVESVGGRGDRPHRRAEGCNLLRTRRIGGVISVRFFGDDSRSIWSDRRST